MNHFAVSLPLHCTSACGRFARARLVILDRPSLEHPLGEAVDVLLSSEDAERFIAEVRGPDAQLASQLRIEPRELEAGLS